MILSLVLALSLHSAHGETTAGDVQKEAAEAVQASKEFAVETKDEFVKTTEEKVAALDRKIEELKAQGKDRKDRASAAWKKEMADLQAKRAKLSKDFGALKKSSGNAWQKMKDGVKSAVNSLEKSYEEAKAEF